MASIEPAPIAAAASSGGSDEQKKMVQHWNWDATRDGAVHPTTSSVTTRVQEQDHRDQPWQSLLNDLQREGSINPEGSDLFPCHDGFYAHSLAA